MPIPSRFSYASLPVLTGTRDGEDGGDILLQSINDEDAEYGGSLEEVRSHVCARVRV